MHPFYVPADEEPFICSDPSSHGMTHCSDIPKLTRNNMTCHLNLTISGGVWTEADVKNGCINWNQYYRSCTASDENPFSGSISFDHIGLAWLAIFQVSDCCDTE